MQCEGESSVVQVIFTEKVVMCVVHPGSVLPEFSNSRSQQSLMSVSFWAWFWECFQVVFTGWNVTGAAFQFRMGRARSMPTLMCAPKVSKKLRFLIYCARLNQTSISGSPPMAAQQKRVYNQSVPIYSLTGMTESAALIGKKKKKLPGCTEPVPARPIHVIGKNASGLRRREHVLFLTAV